MTNLDPTILVAALALVGVLGGALISRGVETRRIITGAPEGYAKLVDDLQQERAELRAQVKAYSELVLDLRARMGELDSMRERVRSLEDGQAVDRRLIDVLRSHIVELRSVIRRAGITPPPAPAGSGVEDSGEHLAVSPA